MKTNYWFILIAYIAMQLSGVIGIPLIIYGGGLFGKSPEDMGLIAMTSWTVFSFLITLIITLILLRKEMKDSRLMRDAAPVGSSVAWAIGGVFLALFAQTIVANIEIQLLGIEMGSENTQKLIRIIQATPIFIIVTSIIGPILEEIVFRKIIFGELHKRINFILSALISSFIFAAAHGEFEHILLYTAMGFTFAFLYVKTKRILVPIFSHVAMNTIVVILQLNQDQIMNWLKEMEQIQAFVGGYFL